MKDQLKRELIWLSLCATLAIIFSSVIISLLYNSMGESIQSVSRFYYETNVFVVFFENALRAFIIFVMLTYFARGALLWTQKNIAASVILSLSNFLILFELGSVLIDWYNPHEITIQGKVFSREQFPLSPIEFL